MSDTNEDRRASGRRKKTRRAYDLLDEVATEEERQAFDRLLRRGLMHSDRREQNRRSDKDRRKMD